MIYLNSAASSFPRAPGVARAISDALERPPKHPGRSATCTENAALHCREQLASLLGVKDATRIVHTQNATHAINIAIRGLIESRDEMTHVITSVAEHNAVLRPLNHLAHRKRARISIVGFDADGKLDRERFSRALADGADFIVLNHASNVTGRVNDVGPLFAEARKSGAITMLDASQSLGHIPVNAGGLSCDMIAFTGHKGLHGPPGTGGLYVASGIDLEQTIVGGTGGRSDLEYHPVEMPERLEAGTPNMPAIEGLSAALNWLAGRESGFLARERELGVRLREELAKIPGMRVFDNNTGGEVLGVVSCRLDGWEPREMAYALEQSFGIICRAGLHCAPLMHRSIASWPHGTVRFSVTGFNTAEDVEKALEAVRTLAESRGKSSA
jgi:cysteine desulfurase family protein